MILPLESPATIPGCYRLEDPSRHKEGRTDVFFHRGTPTHLVVGTTQSWYVRTFEAQTLDGSVVRDRTRRNNLIGLMRPSPPGC